MNIVPFENIPAPVLTPETDGSQGKNRSPLQCKLSDDAGDVINTDIEAVAKWLARAGNAHTKREYRREIERFMLWCLIERRKPMSSATVPDAQAYRAFLAKPTPADRWIGRRRRRGPEWKPFEGPLAPSSIRQAMVIIGQCFAWLVKVRYLDFDVFDEDLVRVSQDRTTTQTDRNLSERALNRLMDWLYEQPESPQVLRWRFTVPFLVMTGLRRAEMVETRMGQFVQHVAADGNKMWHLAIVGKGSKARMVAVPDMTALIAYRRSLKLLDYPMAGEMHPLWAKLRGSTCAHPSALDRDFRLMARRAGKAIEAQAMLIADPMERSVAEADAAMISRVSAHWLRHAHGTLSVNKGKVPLKSVKGNMGHAKLDTTLIYSHDDLEERFRDLAGWVGNAGYLRGRSGLTGPHGH